MQKVKTSGYFFVILLAGLLAFYAISPEAATSAAVNPFEETLRGVVQQEIYEETDQSESFSLFFIQKSYGTDVLRVYLDGDVDFQNLVNREVELGGFGYNPLEIPSDRREDKEIVNQNFRVLGIPKVIEGPVINNVVNLSPLTVGPRTIGPRKVLFQILNLATAPPTNQYTPQQIKNWVFTGSRSANKYMGDSSSSSSSDKLTLVGVNDPSGDVTEPTSMNVVNENCVTNIPNAWRITADNLAESQGFSKTAYKIRIHAYASIPGCNMSAAATVGIFGDAEGVTYIFLQLPSSGTDESLNSMLKTLVHEMFHCLGQGGHSRGQQVEGGTICDNCDQGDPLGSTNIILPHVVNLWKFGWEKSERVHPPIEYRGTYNVYLQIPTKPSKGIGPNSPQQAAVVLLRDVSGNPVEEAYIYEYRTTTPPWDIFASDMQAYVNAVAIRRVSINLDSPTVSTTIVDTTPLTLCCKDAPLRPGATFVSGMYGVSSKAFYPTPKWQLVQITLGDNYPVRP